MCQHIHSVSDVKIPDAMEARAQFLIYQLIRPGQLLGLIFPDDPKKATPVAACYDPESAFSRNLVRYHLLGKKAKVEVRPVRYKLNDKEVFNAEGKHTYPSPLQKIALGLYQGGSCDMGGNLTASFILDADASWKTDEALSRIKGKDLKDQWKADRKKDPQWRKAETEMLDSMRQEAQRIFPQMVFFRKDNGRWHGHCNLDNPIDAWSLKVWVTQSLTPILRHVEVFPKTAKHDPPDRYSAGNHVRVPWGDSGYEIVGPMDPMVPLDTSPIPIGPQEDKEKTDGTKRDATKKEPRESTDFKPMSDDVLMDLEKEFKQETYKRIPLTERVCRYQDHLMSDAYPRSVSGNKGHDRLLLAVRERYAFGVPREQARTVIEKYNLAKCDPAWSDAEIQHKLAEAKACEDCEPGFRLVKKCKSDPDPVGFRTPSKGKVKAYSLHDLEGLSREDVPWVLSGYLARGAVSMIHGSPKIGKSTLVFAMAKAILSGRPFLGRPSEKCGIVYLTEENADTIIEKADAFGIERQDRIRFISNRLSMGCRIQDAKDEILATAKGIDAGLIVIDTVSAWAGWSDDQENKSAQGERFAAIAKEIAAKANVAVLLVHHSRKGLSDDPINSARGTSGLTGACDIVCMLQRTPKGWTTSGDCSRRDATRRPRQNSRSS